MSDIQLTSGVNIRQLQATTWTTAKVDCPVAGTIYSYTFPASTKKFSIVADKARLLKVAPSAGNITSGNYWPVIRSAYSEDGVLLSAFTIYFSSDFNLDTIFIQCWA